MIKRVRWMPITVTLLLFLWLSWPAHAQLSRAIVEPFSINSMTTSALRVCDNSALCRFYGAIYPRLFEAASLSEPFIIESAPSLARDWTVEGDVYTVRLREDLQWTDGTPVTAYDVFYSFWIYFNDSRELRLDLYGFASEVIGARPIDDHTIAFQFRNAGCDDLSRLTFLVLPPLGAIRRGALIEAAQAFFADAPADIAQAWDQWVDTFNISRFPITDNQVIDPALPYLADTAYYRADLPERAVIYPRDPQNPLDGYEIVATEDRIGGFLQGDFNLIADPAYDRVSDLQSVTGSVRVTAPSSQVDYLLINFTNPREPRSYDGEDDPDIANEHPLFADLRVRQALRAAIDVPALIEASVLGYGYPSGMLEPFGSWSHNEAIAPLTFDPREAERLLDAAGWKVLRGDAVRSCVDCAYADNGTLLSFTLDYVDTMRHQITAQLLEEMWERVGFRVDVQPFENLADVGSGQLLDVILTAHVGGTPYRAFPYQHLSQSEDVLNTGRNYGSYVNPAFDERLAAESACEQPERAALYTDLTQILAEDVAVIPLFSPEQVWVTGPNVILGLGLR